MINYFLNTRSENYLMAKNLLLLGFTFITFFVSGQQKMLQNDKDAVDTLFFSDLDKALELSEKNIPIALALNDTNFITYFLDQAGELNRKSGKYDRAIEQLQNCLQYKKYWKDLKDLSLTHNNLGKTYLNKGQYELAVYHFLEALKLMEVDNNLMGQGFYLNNLAAVYDLQHNYIKALEYYEKSLTIKKEIGDSTGIAASYTNLGITNYNLNDYNKAVDYNQKAYEIYSKLGSQTKVARTLNNLGECYLELNEPQKALYYHQKAFGLDSLNEDEYLRISITSNLGNSFMANNEMDSARFYVLKAEEMAKETNSFKNLKDIYLMQSRIAESENDHLNALFFLKKYVAYNDSLVNEANIYAVMEMEGKYEHEKNLRKISDGELVVAQKERLIQQEKLKVFYWVGLSIFLIVAVFVFVILFFLKQKNAQLLTGQMLLINARNNNLKELNQKINLELDRTQISLEEKEELINNVFTSSKNKELPPEILTLSKREMEVLSHLALGWSDDQLAEKLFVSKSTIKTHLRRIYAKLLVRGRAEAVSVAHKYDLIGGIEKEL
jgi:tetratricopeptide (TPR) repeat protein/DNA-binding CsgD family transcriptional regulator